MEQSIFDDSKGLKKRFLKRVVHTFNSEIFKTTCSFIKRTIKSHAKQTIIVSENNSYNL